MGRGMGAAPWGGGRNATSKNLEQVERRSGPFRHNGHTLTTAYTAGKFPVIILKGLAYSDA
jgi:hypothetical protein